MNRLAWNITWKVFPWISYSSFLLISPIYKPIFYPLIGYPNILCLFYFCLVCGTYWLDSQNLHILQPWAITVVMVSQSFTWVHSKLLTHVCFYSYFINHSIPNVFLSCKIIYCRHLLSSYVTWIFFGFPYFSAAGAFWEISHTDLCHLLHFFALCDLMWIQWNLWCLQKSMSGSEVTGSFL